MLTSPPATQDQWSVGGELSHAGARSSCFPSALLAKVLSHACQYLVVKVHEQQCICQFSFACRCVLEYQFKCEGFDYEVLPETCWLTELTPERAHGINVADGWDYYERNPGKLLPPGPTRVFRPQVTPDLSWGK